MATSYSDNVNVDYLLEKRDTQPPLQVTRDQAVKLSQINQQAVNVPPSVMVQATKQNADNNFIEGLTEFFSKAKASTYGKLKTAFQFFSIFLYISLYFLGNTFRQKYQKSKTSELGSTKSTCGMKRPNVKF